MMERPETLKSHDVIVEPLRERDLPAADHVMRVAFGTFIGVPEPATFMGDADYVHTRWRANPQAAFAAWLGDNLIGSNFATNWGSVGFFGPLTTHPDVWNAGVGKRLMEPVMECFERWGTRHAGLFTFANSQKHVGLYQKFGFSPRFLTMVMAKAVQATSRSTQWLAFSKQPATRQQELLRACTALTSGILEGLDLSDEINSVQSQKLGDTILTHDDSGVSAFALCHCGPGTEAGSGSLYVKFGAARRGSGGAADFDKLLAACEQYALQRGATRLVAGVNSAREEAYGVLRRDGFRTEIQGVAMQRPNQPGYNTPGVYLIDDWR